MTDTQQHGTAGESDLTIFCPAGYDTDCEDKRATDRVRTPVKVGRSFCVCGTYGAHYYNSGSLDLSTSCELYVRCRVLKDGDEVLKKDARPEIVGKWSTRHTFEVTPNPGDVFLVEAQLRHKTFGPMSAMRTIDVEYDPDVTTVVCTGDCRDFLHERTLPVLQDPGMTDLEESKTSTPPSSVITILCPIEEDERADRSKTKRTLVAVNVGRSFCVCGEYGARFHKTRTVDLSTSCELYIRCDVRSAGTTILDNHVRPEIVGRWSTRHTFDPVPTHGDEFLVYATLRVAGVDVDEVSVPVKYDSGLTKLACTGFCRDFLHS
jgi:hypothetical protein